MMNLTHEYEVSFGATRGRILEDCLFTLKLYVFMEKSK